MNYYDGQIITDHTAFANWTNANGNKFYDESNGDGTYTVHEVPAPSIAQQVVELKAKLADTDYVVIKIAEATGEDADALREKYAQVIADRKEWRKQINELENSSEQVSEQVEQVEQEPEIQE